MLSALASPGFGKQHEIADAIRSPKQTIKVNNLPNGYRAIIIGNGDNGLYGGLMNYGLGNMGSPEDKNQGRSSMFVSLIGSIFVDPDRFADLLEGHLPRIQGYTLDLPATLTANLPGTGNSSIPNPIFIETWIEGGKILQWTPRPGLTTEALVATFAPTRIPTIIGDKAAEVARIAKVSGAFSFFAQDHNGTFPKADSTEQARMFLAPYSHSPKLWITGNPNGGRILVNTALSGLPIFRSSIPPRIPVLWDEKLWPDGDRVVGYSDVQAAEVSRQEWDQSVWPNELTRRQIYSKRSRH